MFLGMVFIPNGDGNGEKELLVLQMTLVITRYCNTPTFITMFKQSLVMQK
jgi:hypothetical protein